MTREDLENAILDTEEEWIEDALPKTMGRQKRSAHGWLKPVIAAPIRLFMPMLWLKRSIRRWQTGKTIMSAAMIIGER